jgi:PAS domain S-box-containing protein
MQHGSCTWRHGSGRMRAGTRVNPGATYEERFRLMVEGVVDYAILILDLDGRVETWNAGAERFTGYLPAEIIGEHFSIFYTAEDAALGKPERELMVTVAEGRSEDEGWRVRKDGTRFWANVVVTALRNEDGELRGYSKVTRDLTERRAAELHLQASKERFRLMVEGVLDYAILMVDLDGRVETWNAGAERFTGYQPAEIIGQQLSVLYTAEDVALGKPERELATAAAEGRFEDEGWRVRKDGTRFWANAVITGLRAQDGELRGYSSTTRDLTASRAAQLRLQASEALVAGVLAAATEISIIGTDLQGLITVFNSGAERMLGYSSAEMVGVHTTAYLHDPEEMAARAAELEIDASFEVLVHEARRGRAETREWTYFNKAGKRIRVSLVVTAVRDEDDALVGYIGIARDITQSDIAEAERAAIARVARAVAASADLDDVLSLVTREIGEMHAFEVVAIMRFDEGHIATGLSVWSRSLPFAAGLEMTLDGDTASAVVRRTGRVAPFKRYAVSNSELRRIFSPDQHLVEFAAAAPIVVDGKTWGALAISARADRTLSWAPEEGLVRFADLVNLAIANAESRRALQRGRDELRTIIDHLPASVWVCSPAGELILSNQTFDEAAARSALTGEAFDPEAVSPERVEQAFVDASGCVRTHVVARSPLRDRSGKVYAVCGVATDITERREIERTKDEFVSVVSHELRTPLSAIRGALALLADETDLDSASQRRMIEIALSSSERLTNLINDILDLQRIESGSVLLDLEGCDAAALVADAVGAMESLGVEHGVSMASEVPPLRVWGDRRLIAQVLVNLLGNAIKFSAPGGRVVAGAEVVGDEVRFFVRDEGPGIPADKLELIFDRFTQLDSSDSRDANGTGLGLAICRRIADQHHGRIWAESELGAGSCFWFALPELSNDVRSSIEPVPAPARRLVICGQPTARGEIRTLLRGSGLAVSEVATLAEALRIDEEPLLAIVVDVEPMGHASRELLDEIARAAASEVPIIVISERERTAEDALTSIEWIVKPATPDRLLGALATVSPYAGIALLVVEDDESLASVIVERLARAGFAAMHARSGREAVAMATWWHPSVIVLDVALPVGDGFEVVDVLRARSIAPSATVVYTAAELDREARARLQLGPTEFFTKSRMGPEQFNDHLVELLRGLHSSAR